MFPAMEADEGRNRQHGAGSPANCTRRKILNRAYRVAMWCLGLSPPQTHEIVYSDESKRAGLRLPLLFLGTGRVRAIFLAGDDNASDVPSLRPSRFRRHGKRRSVCGNGKIWYDRCNFAARFMNCVLINYPGTRETSVG
jgi:hypothetical protein